MEKLDALGDAALRSTLLFVRSRSRPPTADEVAVAFGVPRTVARSRLERLLAAGLLVAGYERRSGRTGPGAGRPAKTYGAAVESDAIEFPRRRYETLIMLLAATLPGRRRARQLEEVGYAFGTALGRAARLRRAPLLPRALENLCRGLGRLGFHAEVEAASADAGVVVSATCPLRPLIVADVQARAIDEGMWRGLIAAAAGEHIAARAHCGTHNCLQPASSCRIVVSLTSHG
jgi:predicted ArsR family transcriptional regulator